MIVVGATVWQRIVDGADEDELVVLYELVGSGRIVVSSTPGDLVDIIGPIEIPDNWDQPPPPPFRCRHG